MERRREIYPRVIRSTVSLFENADDRHRDHVEWARVQSIADDAKLNEEEKLIPLMTNKRILPVNGRVFLINEFRRYVMILSMREREQS